MVTRLHSQNGQMIEADLEESFQRGHGKGGQHQNKTSSAVRLKHKPTGLEVFINGRSQMANRKTARNCLSGKIKTFLESGKSSSQYGGAGRGDKIRTYNFSDHRISDHRSNKKVHLPDLIMKDGKFELLR